MHYTSSLMFLDAIFQNVGAWKGNFKNSRKRSTIREDVKDHTSTVTGNLFNATVAAKKKNFESLLRKVFTVNVLALNCR